ncbi:hypothetical protein ITI46_30560 [Streptomyces oryzae]|uniref:TrbL/VirB6 plasmid conjugal transfer protein n=1 Tax=Streptomyces oryzae TaxID=1434886 RepID=A0ABS3XKN2_9ACTN|nr:hypothetical protein [Streptomyces oryzae]MBO8195956.1 hypothetical protein [Streptomyces oryzae]
MDCDGGTGSPFLDALKGFFEFLGDPIGSIVKGIADMIMAGAISAFGAVTATVPTFLPAKSDPVHAQVRWLVVYVAVGSLLFACIRMAAERQGEPGTTALKGMVRLIVVAGGGTAIVGAAASVGDDFSNHLFAGAVNEQIQNMGCSSSSSVEPFLLLILAFLLLIAAIVHTILLYVRLGVMIVLFGTLPLAAAASMSNWGGGWWRKHIGWMIAWLLYKPTAGLIIYAGSDLLTGGEGGGEEAANIHAKIAGICVMLLSAIALPALLKLIVPATAALGGESAYSSAVSAGGGAIASGAKSLAGGAGSSGGGSGAKGPSGASGGGGQSGHGSSGPSGMANGAMGSGGGGGGGSGQSSGGGGSGPSGGGSGGSGGSGHAGGGSGGGSGGAPSGAARGAGAAAGPVGMAVEAAVAAAKTAGKLVGGSVDGADGSKGHNQ